MTLAAMLSALVLWVVPPSPEPMPTVFRGPCPGMNDYGGCYYGGDMSVIFVRPDMDEFMLQHELGHAYDELELNDGERRALMKALRWDRWHSQRFADWYAGCRTAENPRLIDPWIYRPFRSPERIARRCAMIARAGVN